MNESGDPGGRTNCKESNSSNEKTTNMYTVCMDDNIDTATNCVFLEKNSNERFMKLRTLLINTSGCCNNASTRTGNGINGC